jgi:hypothetical protein
MLIDKAYSVLVPTVKDNKKNKEDVGNANFCQEHQNLLQDKWSADSKYRIGFPHT